jgi:hypothetical protein
MTTYMNPQFNFKTTTPLGQKLRNRPALPCALFLIAFLFAWFALSPAAHPTDLGSVVPGANTADGSGVLINRTTGVWNTGIGFQTLYHDTTGYSNTAEGIRALFNNVSGRNNVANGIQPLFSNTSGSGNTANGYQALYHDTTGSNNVAYGPFALYNSNGAANIAVGADALYRNFNGGGDIAVGFRALYRNNSGSENVALGNGAGSEITAGDFTIHIGNTGNAQFPFESGTIRIGEEGDQTATYIAGIYNAVASGGSAVYVDSNDKLGTSLSSRRFKDEIKPIDKASESILALKPVTFRYRKDLDPEGIPQFGLVAEDVEQVNPDLVVRDAKGNVESVRYEAVNAMLLSEFLKQHRKVAEQQTTMTQLQKSLGKVIARLDEQETQIDKVSARLRVTKPATPQIVTNNQ